MIQGHDYVNLRGELMSVADLPDEEQKFVAQLKRQAKQIGDWNEFENYWISAVGEFFKDRGLSRKQIRQMSAYRIAQDLGSRLAVESGVAHVPDYRDDLTS